MSDSKQIRSPLYYYLGLLQLITALSAAIVGLLFVKYAHGSLYNFILSFFPDSSLLNWSIIGILMIVVQVLGNLIGVGFSLFRSKSAVSIAFILGVIEIIWLTLEYFKLHMHHILMLLFFILALARIIVAYILNEKLDVPRD
jgi:hypothetical protein